MAVSLPPVIESAAEILADFDEPTKNLPTLDGRHYAPYLLNGPQVGSVALLLWKS
jgi:hypothetical protein